MIFGPEPFLCASPRLCGALSEFLPLVASGEPIRPRTSVSTAQKSWGAMGTPIQFGPLRLNEPFELPSEFMFWLFSRRIAGFKEGNF